MAFEKPFDEQNAEKQNEVFEMAARLGDLVVEAEGKRNLRKVIAMSSLNTRESLRRALEALAEADKISIEQGK